MTVGLSTGRRVEGADSALVLRRIPPSEQSHTYNPCDIDGCLTKMGNNRAGYCRSMAAYEAIVCGWNAGWLCPAHAREWRASWDEAAA